MARRVYAEALRGCRAVQGGIRGKGVVKGIKGIPRGFQGFVVSVHWRFNPLESDCFVTVAATLLVSKTFVMLGFNVGVIYVPFGFQGIREVSAKFRMITRCFNKEV